MNFPGGPSSFPAKKGATCYLKSVLQVLQKTEDFREAVIRHSNENHDTDFIDHHLKTLFEDRAANTDEIIKTLDIDDVHEQRDAAEYFERILRMASPQASRIFRGVLANKTSCSKCHTETNTDAPFWHLPLALVDSCSDTRGSEVYRVVDGIKEFFRPTELNGENQMYCDCCGHKVDATIADVIKHHPDVLILLLKRCEFNYHYMSYVKTRCSVEVPYTLQIPESQTYELYAAVDHLGDLRGGHYTATIRIPEEHEDTWYHYNDTSGTRLRYQPFQVDNTEKSESAYLLFYRKKHAATEELMEMHTNQSFPPSNTNNSDQCQEVGKEAEEAEVHKNAAVNFSVIKNGETITGDKTLLFKNTSLQEDVRGHENVGQAIVNYDFTDKPAAQGQLNNQDERSDGQKGQMDLIPERDEQTEKEEEALTKHSHSHRDYQGDEGSDNVRQDTGEYEGGTQNVGNDYSLKYASVEADKQTTGEIRLLPEYGSQDNQTGSDRMQIIPKGNNQWQKQGNSSRFLTGRIEEEVKGDTSVHNVIYSTHKDVGVKTQTRDVRDDRWEQKGADEYFQRSKIIKEKPDHSETVKFESMRLEDAGQKTTEKIIRVTNTSQSVVGVEIRRKEQQNEGDSKQNQSEGNRTLKERLTEKQGADNNENIRLESFQPNARSGIQGVTEGGRHSKKPSPRVKVIDEEHTEILSASKHNSKPKTVIRITVDETVQDTIKWQESQKNIRKSLNI